MSDRDWQHVVLRDLGAAEAGLADPRPPGPVPQPAPVPPERVTGSGPAMWYPEGSVAGGEATEPAPPVLGAPPPPGREPTAAFGLPQRDSARSAPPAPEHPGPAGTTPESPPADRQVAGRPVPEQPGPAEPHAPAADLNATMLDPPPFFGQPTPSGDAQQPTGPPGPAPIQPDTSGQPRTPATAEGDVPVVSGPPGPAPIQPDTSGQPWASSPAEGDAPAVTGPPGPAPIQPAVPPHQPEAPGQPWASSPEGGEAPAVAGPLGPAPIQPWTHSPAGGEGPAAPVIGGPPGPAPIQPPVAPHGTDAVQPPEAPIQPWASSPAEGDAPAVTGPPGPAPIQPSAASHGTDAAAETARSAPADDVEMSADALVRRKAHGDSALRRVGRGMRKVVGVTAAGEMREMTGMVQRLQSPVPSCRRIAVTSIRGGAGKTTVAALLASVIAEHREDRVLAIDADSGLGSLPLRLGVRPERSMHDLATARPRSWDETAQYLARTEQGLWVMSGTAHGRVSELDLETFQAAASGVSRYFSAAVIDCGAGIVARLQRGVLAAAHAQVFVTPGTVDGALSARQTLSWFVGSGYEQLLSRTVVVLVTHSPHADGDADLERARQVLSDGGMPVVVVPYDRHLATGTAITPSRVSGTVRTAASWIAAEVFARSLSGGAL